MSTAVAPRHRKLALSWPATLNARYDEALAAEFLAQPIVPLEPLLETDLGHLPAPVRRYIERSGAVGKPRVQNLRLELEAQMWRAPGQAPIPSTSVQHNFFGRPARVFLMRARMFGLPVRALHVYTREEATFTVRVASLVNMVDLRGSEISRAETVTVLNDMAAFAPGSLAGPGPTWVTLDDRTAAMTFTNGPHQVTATLVFNEEDQLVDFVSDDRPDGSTGTFRPMRWSTPLADYLEMDGRRLPTSGAAMYARPDGDFTYGRFRLKSIAYNVEAPIGTRVTPEG